MTSGARRSCPSRSRYACHPAQRAGSKTRCPGTTAAQGAATPAAGGDCSGCGGKRRREPGPAYSQEKPLLSTQRPARSCSPEAVSGMSRPHHRKTLGASVPQSCIQGLGRQGLLPRRVQCSSPELLVGPGRPSKAQDTAPLSFQPKHPPPFRLEKCANDPRGEDQPLVCRHPHGACTKAQLRLRRRWQLTLFAKCQRNG